MPFLIKLRFLQPKLKHYGPHLQLGPKNLNSDFPMILCEGNAQEGHPPVLGCVKCKILFLCSEIGYLWDSLSPCQMWTDAGLHLG